MELENIYAKRNKPNIVVIPPRKDRFLATERNSSMRMGYEELLTNGYKSVLFS